MKTRLGGKEHRVCRIAIDVAFPDGKKMPDTVLEVKPEEATVKYAIGRVQAVVGQAFDKSNKISILEAGCGSCSHFDLGSDAYVVGIDTSQSQLDRNVVLNEKICADIETHELDPAQFDLVFCWYVLEHLRQPQVALARLAAALRKDGLLVISVPSVWSLKGLATKFTPHCVHVLVYRWLLGRRNARRNDCAPFPTFLKWSTRPSAVRRFAHENDLAIEFYQRYEDFTQRKLRAKYKSIRLIYKLLHAIATIVSVGRYNVYLTDYAMVLRNLRRV